MRAYFKTTEFATANLFWLYLLKIDQRKIKDNSIFVSVSFEPMYSPPAVDNFVFISQIWW